jgi:hypothetical protein
MPSVVDYGLLLYFIVTKIVTSVLWGAVVDGACKPSGGREFFRVFGRTFGRRSRLHAAPFGPDHPPPSPAREPPVRAGQRSAYPSPERASTTRPAVRFLSPPSPRLPDDRSRADQEPKDPSRSHTQRPRSYAGFVDHQRTARHRAPASLAAPPALEHATRLGNLSGPCSTILWICIRSSTQSFVVEAVAKTAPSTTNLAIADRIEPGLLRRDLPLGSSRRSPGHPSATKIAPRYRPLHLADLPDELSQETHVDPVAGSAGSVRRRLLSAARLQGEALCPSATHY